MEILNRHEFKSGRDDFILLIVIVLSLTPQPFASDKDGHALASVHPGLWPIKTFPLAPKIPLLFSPHHKLTKDV